MKYIFIGGAGRSGTTLVQKVLLGHPNINGGPEFYFTKHITTLYKNFINSHKTQSFHPSINKEDIKKAFLLFYNTYQKPYQDSGILFIAEKTPTNIDVVDDLLDLFEDALFINVYRDGRAVLNSHFQVKKRAWKKGKNLTEINLLKTSMYWSECIKNIKKVKKSNISRVYNLKYEDLINNPTEEFYKLFKYLGIESYEGVRSPEEIKNTNNQKMAHINQIWYTDEMFNKGYDNTRLDNWKIEMNLFRKYIGSSIMFNELNELGYSVKTSEKMGNMIFNFMYNLKSNIKEIKLIQPLLYLKRWFQ